MSVRRGRWGAVTVVVLLALLLAACDASGSGTPSSSPPPAVAAADAPDIVLITTDDQTLREMRYLPQTRALLGEGGTTFREFVAPHPLCCPSRAQLLTGQYAQNNGVRRNSGLWGGYPAFDPSTALPVWLQAAGYRTAMVGKYLNGYEYELPEDDEVGWDTWEPTVSNIYRYVGFGQFDDGEVVTPGGYHTQYVGGRSSEIIAESADDDRPLFLWTSLVAPHGVCGVAQDLRCETPPRPALEHFGRYADLRPSFDSPSFNEVDVSDKPRLISRLDPVDRSRIRKLSARRAEALLAVDDAVAEIVGALRAAGTLEETVIAFTSDNGYLMGEHRYVGKALAYEESVRVPLLMRGPGIPAGATRDQTAAMIDLAPTFASLAGAFPLVPQDGQDLTPIVRDDPPQEDRTLLVQAGARGGDELGTGWLFRGVRTDRYTYVGWSSGFVELYDRRVDPFQVDNLADDQRYGPVRFALTRRTNTLGDCGVGYCRAEFSPLPAPSP